MLVLKLLQSTKVILSIFLFLFLFLLEKVEISNYNKCKLLIFIQKIEAHAQRLVIIIIISRVFKHMISAQIKTLIGFWCKKLLNLRSRGNVQNSLAKELYIVSYTTFKTIKETSISSFRNSRFILELDSKRLARRVWKCHIDLESLRLEF